MKKILLCMLIFLFLGLIVNAQIKVVGDDYIDSLSASKNYFDRDIDFDAVFPAVPPQEIKGELKYCFNYEIQDINLSGDTIYLFSPYELYENEFAINNLGKVTPTKTIPIGYYIITGYVICIDNENAARESAGLKAYEYDTYTGGPQSRTIKNLKKDILLGKEIDDGYIRMVTLAPVDKFEYVTDEKTPVVYYCQHHYHRGLYYDGNNIQLRFYNEARKFIGKEMVIGIVQWDSLRSIKTIVDDYTGVPVKLADKSFIAKDIVMNGNSLYIVLQGEKTGTFAHKLKTIRYVYDKNDLIGGRENEPDKCDIACLFERSQSFDTSFICINDLRTLYERPRITEAQRQKEMQLKNQQLEKRKIEQKEAYKRIMIEKYGENIGILVGNRQVAIGMTFEMVRDSWGRPMNTYRTTTKYGQSEVWCYNYKTRVYFFDGKVVQIDD